MSRRGRWIQFSTEKENAMNRLQKMLAALLLAVPLVPFSVSAESDEAAPFGLKMGMTRAQLGLGESVKALQPGKYQLTTVPKPHPDFEAYIVQVAPTSGLCFIKAMGKNVDTSVYGSELKRKYEDVREQLGATYGKYEEIDMLRTGSIWDEPRDWMMGLLKKERILGAVWKKQDATMKPGLDKVFVGATALSREKGFVVIEYYFDNEPQCQQEIDKEKRAALGN
jgi:hypothetical protein